MHLVVLAALVWGRAPHPARPDNIHLEGDLTFSLKVSDFYYKEHQSSSINGTESRAQTVGDIVTPGNANARYGNEQNSTETAAPVEECMYQYPERSQINALLSNMLNELTRVYVKVRGVAGETRRKHGTRYVVIHKKDTAFFDEIFDNITHEYIHYYNKTAGRVARSGGDPCMHQDEIKLMWQLLLGHALDAFRGAAARLQRQLGLHGEPKDAAADNRLRQFVIKEVGKLKKNQLHLLCDTFQLCYHELL